MAGRTVIRGIATDRILGEGEGTLAVRSCRRGLSGGAGLASEPESDNGSGDGLIAALNLTTERGGGVERVCARWSRRRHIRAASSEDGARCQKREQISL